MVFVEPVPATVRVFASLCEQVQAENSLTRKSELIQGCVRRWSGDLTLLFLHLLPKYTGRVYQLKDKTLIKHLSAILKTPESVLKDHADKCGCIATTAQHYFQPALGVGATSTMTLADMEAALAELATQSTEDYQRGCMARFFAKATKTDVFIYMRQIKLDLRLGAGIRIVLNGLHASANDLYKQTASIVTVVQKVVSGDTALAAGDADDDAASGRSVSPSRLKAGRINASITLGTPISPMLAAPSRGAAGVIAKCPNGVYSETKYDGERIQIHKAGSKFTFYARSTKPMKADKYEGLEKHIMSAVKATDCVLDGEILLVDTRTSQPLPFGTLGKHKKAQFTTANTAIFLFDLLYLDGETMLNVPLDKRRERMRQVVDVIPNRILFSDLRIMSGSKDQQTAALNRHLQFAIKTGLEGLVCKDTKSTYEPGSRHWIKLKKDYLEGMGDTADLLMLGAWYGTGARGGKLSTFLMGVLDTSASPAVPKRFKTVTAVANGFDDTQLAALQPALKEMTTATNGVAPVWLDAHSSNLPDVVLKDPMTAPVWEIMCNEYTQSTSHTADNISMRFGRIIRIRDDKDVTTATSLQYLHTLVKASKATGPSPDDENLDVQAHEREGAVAGGYVPAPPSAVPAAPAAAAVAPTPVAAAAAGGMRQPKIQFPGAAGAATAAPSPAAAVSAGWAGASAAAERSPGRAAPAAAAAAAGGSAGPLGRRAPTSLVSGPVHTHGELLRTVSHDVAQPISVPGIANMLIVHVAALHGRWSTRGVMGAITRTHGDDCREAYDAASKQVKLGDIVVVEVSNRLSPGRLLIATLVAQSAAPGVGKAPQVDHDALERGFVKASKFARENDASVHFARPDKSTGINWKHVEDLICKHFTPAKVHVTVYSREAAPSGSAGAGSVLASVPQDPTPRVHAEPRRHRPESPPLRTATAVPAATTAAAAATLLAPSSLGGDGGAGAPGILDGCRIIVVTGDADAGHLTKRQAEAVKQKATMLGATSVVVQDAAMPSPPGTTHIVTDGDRLPESIPSSACAVVKAWVDASFAENRRVDDARYRAAGAPPAKAVPPSVLKPAMTEGELVPRGSVTGLFNVMDGAAVVVSAQFLDDERSELSSKVSTMGGVPQTTWVMMGANKSTHYVAPTVVEDAEATRILSLGGTVVSRRWLDDAFNRAAMPPVAPYIVHEVSASPGAAMAAPAVAAYKPQAVSPNVAPVAAAPAAAPAVTQSVSKRARTPDLEPWKTHTERLVATLNGFAADPQGTRAPPELTKYRAAATGFAPNIKSAVDSALDALGFRRAADISQAEIVIADTLTESVAAATARSALVVRSTWLLEIATSHSGAVPSATHQLLDAPTPSAPLRVKRAVGSYAGPALQVTMADVMIKSTYAPPSIGKQGAMGLAAAAAVSPGGLTPVQARAKAQPAAESPAQTAAPEGRKPSELVPKVEKRAALPVTGSSDDDVDEAPPPAVSASRRRKAVVVDSDDDESPPAPVHVSGRRRQSGVQLVDSDDDGASTASTMSYKFHGSDTATEDME